MATQENKLVLIGLASRWEERAQHLMKQRQAYIDTALEIESYGDRAQSARRNANELENIVNVLTGCARDLRLIVEGLD